MFISEKEAEDFLEKNSFLIVDRFFTDSLEGLEKCLISFPWAIKVSGKEIIHKKKIGGVVLNVKNIDFAKKVLKKFSKINGFSGVLIQPMLNEKKEYFFGIKNTEDFSHVLIFGKGGSDLEKEKDVSFRVFPVKKKDFFEMVYETKIGKNLEKKEVKKLYKVSKKLGKLIKKYPTISELDINPLISGLVVDSRIVFD